MFKMGLHDPFGYLKHKLWPKEGPKVKMSTWLSTTKSQELLWFTCVQVARHIPLENSRQRLQIYFKPHFNRRFAQKFMAPRSRGSPNIKNFETSNLGSPKTKWHLGAMWPGTKNTIRGKVVTSPKFEPWWLLGVHVCPWLIDAPKVLWLCTNHLVVWFVQVHVNNLSVCHSS
jgi:hypothetical protein